ncbi:MAG: hypothetical protein WHV66_08320 [Anaerolineales bacterium]
MSVVPKFLSAGFLKSYLINCVEQTALPYGDVDNVVFPCGHVIAPDGDTIYLYYGAADTSVALAFGSVRALLDWLETQGDCNDGSATHPLTAPRASPRTR